MTVLYLFRPAYGGLSLLRPAFSGSMHSGCRAVATAVHRSNAVQTGICAFRVPPNRPIWVVLMANFDRFGTEYGDKIEYLEEKLAVLTAVIALLRPGQRFSHREYWNFSLYFCCFVAYNVYVGTVIDNHCRQGTDRRPDDSSPADERFDAPVPNWHCSFTKGIQLKTQQAGRNTATTRRHSGRGRENLSNPKSYKTAGQHPEKLLPIYLPKTETRHRAGSAGIPPALMRSVTLRR